MTTGRFGRCKATAIASLAKSGYLDMSQFSGTDKMLNLPPRAAQPTEPPEPQGEEEEEEEEEQGEENQEEASDEQ